MATWPSQIKIVKEGYSQKLPDRVIRSAMDVGPGKVRRRSSNAVRKASFSLNLTDAELDIFEEFYLENDAAVFDFPNPKTGSNSRARFVNVPDPRIRDNRWVFQVDLEILP